MISNIFDVCVSMSTWNECSVLMSSRMLVLFIFYVASIAAWTWAYENVWIIQIFEILSLKLETFSFFFFKSAQCSFFLAWVSKEVSRALNYPVEVGVTWNWNWFLLQRRLFTQLYEQLMQKEDHDVDSQPWNLKVDSCRVVSLQNRVNRHTRNIDRVSMTLYTCWVCKCTAERDWITIYMEIFICWEGKSLLNRMLLDSNYHQLQLVYQCILWFSMREWFTRFCAHFHDFHCLHTPQQCVWSHWKIYDKEFIFQTALKNYLLTAYTR